MIKAIIIDDNQNNIQFLKELLVAYCPSVKVLGNANDLREGIRLINDNKPDLVFLDVELEAELGFDLIKKIPDPEFQIIFTTAHSKYAVQAIKSSCLEYLLKPIDHRELIVAIEKFNKHQQQTLNQKRFEVLLANVSGGQQSIHKIAIPIADGYRFLNVEDVIYCEADLNYTKIITNSEKEFLSTKTLKEFEEMLGQQNFFRCHKSWMINLNHIKKYSRSEGNRVQMINDAWIDISSRKREEFLRLFEK